ncbi:hemolysin D [Echinicola pacifica]|uniref:Hemolysin D n=1 Tax=Echinicola pacifica TaxID=346377 RepID=A0A918PNG3_9BACT|nr:efflux RND transporter periplasmic adaptor subunit [Echinicola pacifica]GGZ16504.1 hemolysin D [Echinicola pacifica]
MNYSYILSLILLLSFSGCGNSSETESSHEEDPHEEHHDDGVHLNQSQVDALGLKWGPVEERNLTSYVEANGMLEVPPQNEAAITSMIGANVVSITIIEGDKVSKGQVLAYISHPEIVQIQSDYIEKFYERDFLQQEYERQQTLLDEEVGAGRDLQRTHASLKAMDARVLGLEKQLELLGLQVSKIKEGDIQNKIPIRSPLDGYVKKVHIKMGQYVQPEFEMFEIENIDHIHADLMVYEKDIHKIHEGQKVRFKVQSVPEQDLIAEVYAVGKSFEDNPKAIHLHAEIENKRGVLIPGMYVRGQVLVGDTLQLAVPETAIVSENERNYVFSAEKEGEEWVFKPIEVITQNQSNDWVGISFMSKVDSTLNIVQNQAYYLKAEKNKSEAGHSH